MPQKLSVIDLERITAFVDNRFYVKKAAAEQNCLPNQVTRSVNKLIDIAQFELFEYASTSSKVRPRIVGLTSNGREVVKMLKTIEQDLTIVNNHLNRKYLTL